LIYSETNGMPALNCYNIHNQTIAAKETESETSIWSYLRG